MKPQPLKGKCWGEYFEPFHLDKDIRSAVMWYESRESEIMLAFFCKHISVEEMTWLQHLIIQQAFEDVMKNSSDNYENGTWHVIRNDCKSR